MEFLSSSVIPRHCPRWKKHMVHYKYTNSQNIPNAMYIMVLSGAEYRAALF